jgi:hypothetical protein
MMKGVRCRTAMNGVDKLAISIDWRSIGSESCFDSSDVALAGTRSAKANPLPFVNVQVIFSGTFS